MSTELRSRAWVEVDEAALHGNLLRVRDASGPDCRMLPVVKADAYGLGVARTVAALESAEPWGYGVATVTEGVQLRELGVTRTVLVLTPAPSAMVPRAVSAGLTLSVSSIEAMRRIAREAEASGCDAAIHVEVDTGMGRAGFDWRRASEWGRAVAELTKERVRWEGVFTHFHSADDAESRSVELQGRRFRDAVDLLPRPETGERILHLCNSAGIFRRPELAADLVRPGIFLYGGRAGGGLPTPDTVVSVRARVVLVRDVPMGTSLGYGATYRATRPERWATLGIGYGDGIPRALGNRGHVVMGGRRLPIVGRISMDLTVVDITDAPGAGVDQIATLIGVDDGAGISLEEVSEKAGTNSYEILTGLGRRLPRVWVNDRHSHEQR